MLRERAAPLGEIADALPAIMRTVAESRPLRSGDWELTIAQVRALSVVGGREHCTMGELARQMGISLGAATGLADRLVRQGLIERAADLHDRRVVCLRLSPAGRLARGSLRRAWRRSLARMLDHLSGEELEQIAAALTALHGALGSAPRDAKENPR